MAKLFVDNCAKMSSSVIETSVEDVCFVICTRAWYHRSPTFIQGLGWEEAGLTLILALERSVGGTLLVATAARRFRAG